MKKLLFSLLALLAALAPSLQAQVFRPEFPTWAQSYGAGNYTPTGGDPDPVYPSSGYDLASGIAAMPDGGVVICGRLNLPEFSFNDTYAREGTSTLVRYGADGRVIWQQALRQKNDAQPPYTQGQIVVATSYPYQVLTDADGNIFVGLAQLERPGGGNSIPVVAKFSAAGALIWQNGLFKDNYGNDFGGINVDGVGAPFPFTLTPDGGVMFAGTERPSEAHDIPVYAKFNSDGSLGVHRPFTSSGQFSGFSFSCQSADGSRILSAVDASSGGAVVLTNSATGAFVTARTFYSDAAYMGGVDPIVRALPMADGGFVLLGTNSTLHRVRADLTPMWEKVLVTGSPGMNLAPTSDGGFVLTGLWEIDHEKSMVDVLLLKLDANGNPEFARAIGGPKYDGASPNGQGSQVPLPTAVQTTDGGYAFTCSSFSYKTGVVNSPDFWTVKTDGNGHVNDFPGFQLDIDVSVFKAHGNTIASQVTSFDGSIPQGYLGTSETRSYGIIQEDLSNNTGINKATIMVQTTTPIPPPVHGGLSGMTFTVNESTEPTQLPSPPVLRFRAVQSGRVANQSVRVEVSTDGKTSWQPLADATSGSMTYAEVQDAFVLNSTAYPSVSSVYFRAVAKGSGYPSPFSAPVGPFDLSRTLPHLPPVALLFSRSGTLADLKFTAGVKGAASDVALRVQSSMSPADESSWTDLPDGHRGAMTRSTNTNFPDVFLLLENKVLPDGTYYFRAIAQKSGFLDSISNVTDSWALMADVPPVVSVQVPQGLPGSGDGKTAKTPILLPATVKQFKVGATTNRNLKRLALLIDGRVKYAVTDGSKNIDYATSSISLGDHVVEGVAVDDLGGRSRAAMFNADGTIARPGTIPVYIRVMPATGSAVKASKASGGSETAAAVTAPRVFTAVNDGGFWINRTTWKDAAGADGVPGKNDLAIVGDKTILFVSDGGGIDVGSLSMTGGHLSAFAAGSEGRLGSVLIVNNTATISGGSFDDGMSLAISRGATLNLFNSDNLFFTKGVATTEGFFANFGAVNIHGAGGLLGVSKLDNPGAVNWQLPLTIPLGAGLDPLADARALQGYAIAQSGVINGTGSGLIGQDGGSLISQDGGTLISQDGGTLVAQGAGNAIHQDVSKLISQDGGGFVGNDGNKLVAQGAGNLVAQGAGNLVAQGAGNLVAQGAGNITGPATKASRTEASSAAATAPSGFVQTGGETDLSSTTIFAPVTVNGGLISGSGRIVGDLTNNGGYIAPGHSAGVIAVVGNFTQGEKGTTVLENGGKLPSQFDQLLVGGAAALNGNLVVNTINGYKPDPADTFNPIGYSSVSGSFASVSGNTQLTINADGAIATVNPSVPNVPAPKLLNIATRLAVQQGDNALFAGLIVTGPAGSTKKVIIRGLGPSLAVGSPIADPLLELHDPDGSTVVNDNWQQGDTSQIPTGFSPPNEKESVIVATLTVGSAGYGSYTVVMKGAHDEVGVGLVEVYDLDTNSTAQLANIATRGVVQTGDNVLIGGFIVGGAEPAKVLVRATGPSFGASGSFLQDPVLEIHDSNGAVISNDNWRETQENEIRATGVQPTDDREPAIIATLVPGGYTAVVRGSDDSTGIAVVEAYNLQ